MGAKELSDMLSSLAPFLFLESEELKMVENKPIVLILDDEARRISQLTGISFEIAYQFVLAEDNFFDIKGLNDYGDGEYIEPKDTSIDVAEMLNFIVCKTGIALQTCYRLEDAERKYFSEIGIIEPSDYEGEFLD